MRSSLSVSSPLCHVGAVHAATLQRRFCEFANPSPFFFHRKNLIYSFPYVLTRRRSFRVRNLSISQRESFVHRQVVLPTIVKSRRYVEPSSEIFLSEGEKTKKVDDKNNTLWSWSRSNHDGRDCTCHTRWTYSGFHRAQEAKQLYEFGIRFFDLFGGCYACDTSRVGLFYRRPQGGRRNRAVKSLAFLSFTFVWYTWFARYSCAVDTEASHVYTKGKLVRSYVYNPRALKTRRRPLPLSHVIRNSCNLGSNSVLLKFCFVRRLYLRENFKLASRTSDSPFNGRFENFSLSTV